MKIDTIQTIGSGIIRPEGVMALDDGTLWTADARGCCAQVAPDGRTTFFGDLGGVPNGICVDTHGRCIVANIGNGQVQALRPDGRHEVLLTHADGRRMRAPNFPFVDQRGRLWVSNSTERENLESALWDPTPDGCVVCIADGVARIVADGIYFANGLTLDRNETHLYVAQTMRRNILRYSIGDDGRLGPAEVFGPDPLAEAGIPDGIAFDEGDNLWITFPRWNAVGFLTPAGELRMVLEDPAHRVLQRPANICFGGPRRKTAFIGSLDGTTIPFFPVPYPGMRLVHQKR
ncbi:SMP-30/gluconolactonase/LRE family protein [Desulfatitalea alkaliphila]|uniref:SMP-30/gluconolactonase/LRE family protein n=1 Tax=Desulfatitalea alkaliphila TaxID=2929485 RepID=A0AA41UH45_9BACT|nr:SMP-30/gluconolactonase/LRE family protein [Desulfatitalea alkaliphila]MCJ8499230.1 SMP-30/gluconolactonase/LRE family protein [Desulfatitalea alkaliphila]